MDFIAALVTHTVWALDRILPVREVGPNLAPVPMPDPDFDWGIFPGTVDLS